MVMSQSNHLSFYGRFVKRFLDIVMAILALILLSPIFILTSIAILVNLGSPIIFEQMRPGKNEKVFRMYKFRSMNDMKDHLGNPLSDQDRLPPFGRKLRSSSLDELPELVNILKGDMSFVGPRPLLVEYLPFYHEHERARHSVRPGITGLAQVKGRNSINWEEKFSYDLEYVRNLSFKTDLMILLKTLKVVILRSDIRVGEQHIVGRLDHERRQSSS